MQHGAALGFPIRRALRQFKTWIRANAALEDPETVIGDFVNNSANLAAAEALLPDLYEEMQGVADGADVDIRDLFVYQSFDEFFVYLIESGTLDISTTGHCTTAGVFGRQGKPGLVAHNNDIPTYHEEKVTVLHIKSPDSDLEILQSTFAGQIAQNGVNNRGVGVGINTIADLPGGDGVPVSFHVRRILECANRAEAIAYLQSATFGQAMNYTIVDRTGGATVETWESNAVVADDGENGYVAHTNHALDPDAPRTFQMTAESGGGSYGFTHERLELADTTLSTDSADIDFDGFRALFATRPILVYPGKPTGRTIMSMIAEIPESGPPTLHLSPDSPNLHQYVVFGF
jgi:predicted choloylglycine hydrolase